MKIRLYTILLSFLLPLVCYAQQPEDNLPEPVQLARMNVITVGGGVTAAPAGCTVDNDEELTTEALQFGNSNDGNGTFSDTNDYRATKFVLSAEASITGYTLVLNKQDAATYFTLVAEIWSHHGDDRPNAVVAGTTSEGITDASITTSYTEYFLPLPTPKTGLAADTYWCLVRLSSHTAKMAAIARDTSSVTGRLAYTTDGGSNWSADSNQIYRLKVHGCD